MKKFILFLMLLITSQACFAYDYSQMCAAPPYQVGNGFTQFVSTATGTNFLLKQVAEAQLEKTLKKELNSKFVVKIKPYGAKTFTDGKFKYMEMTSKKIVYNGLSISDFKANTVCKYNHVVYKNKNVYFPENLIYKYSGKITNDDFQNVILSEEYLKTLEKMSVIIGNKIIFKVFDPSAKIENNRLKLSYKVMTPLSFITEVSTVNLTAGLAVENEKIVFSEIELGSSNNKLNLNKMLPLVNRLNPLTYEMKLSKTSNAIVKISTIKINDNKISLDGVFIIPKNYAIKSK